MEWIYLVYLGFFVMAIMSPSLVTKDYFGISQTRIEELLIFVFGLAGLMTFSIYERLVERRMKERDEALSSAERAKSELIESYRYIGSVNRQIDVLKSLVNQTSISLVDTDTYWKDVFQSLTANAAACVNASCVLLRFIELDRLRTGREVFFDVGTGSRPPKISNKELKKMDENGTSHAFLRTENGEEILVVPSDHKGRASKAFFMLATDPSQASSLDVSLIKVFANQAELVYHSLIGQDKEIEVQTNPLDAVEAVTLGAVGEVG